MELKLTELSFKKDALFNLKYFFFHMTPSVLDWPLNVYISGGFCTLLIIFVYILYHLHTLLFAFSFPRDKKRLYVIVSYDRQ